MLSAARIFPSNEVVVPRVAEPVSITQYTPAPAPVSITFTDEPLPVVSELPTRNTHTALALPPPFRVRVVPAAKFIVDAEEYTPGGSDSPPNDDSEVAGPRPIKLVIAAESCVWAVSAVVFAMSYVPVNVILPWPVTELPA